VIAMLAMLQASTLAAPLSVPIGVIEDPRIPAPKQIRTRKKGRDGSQHNERLAVFQHPNGGQAMIQLIMATRTSSYTQIETR
jgi:hypothetical protein